METKIFGDKKLTIAPWSPKDSKCAKEYMDFINELIAEDAKLSTHTKQTL